MSRGTDNFCSLGKEKCILSSEVLSIIYAGNGFDISPLAVHSRYTQQTVDVMGTSGTGLPAKTEGAGGSAQRSGGPLQ